MSKQIKLFLPTPEKLTTYIYTTASANQSISNPKLYEILAEAGQHELSN